jgi:hypothetical protein
MDVQKHGVVIPVGSALISDRILWTDFEAAQKRWRESTPEQRAAIDREYAERRRAEREAQEVVFTGPEDVLARIGKHFGWSPEYVRHLAQPYCDCDYDSDGAWNLCIHASDLGLSPG